MNIWLIVAAVVYFLIQSGKIHLGEGDAAGIDLPTILTYAPWVFIAVTAFSPPMREKIYAWIDSVVPVAGAPVASTDGLRVLIVEDVAARPSLSKDQAAALLSTDVTGYLNAKCIKSPSGQSEWRRLDASATIDASESKFVRDAMSIKRASLPWLYAVNGRKFYNGPLPKDVESTLATLRKVGGQ